MNKKAIILSLMTLFLVNATAIDRQCAIINWEFIKGDLASSWEAFRINNKTQVPMWKAVTVPHCFNAYDAVDPDIAYYEGPGWYRTNITVDNPYQDGRTILKFEGAGQKTQVYIYQNLVLEHVGGYDEFQVDITEAIAAYKKDFPETMTIPLAVRCDNTRDVEMIPSDLSDFNIYGGLYRHVNLCYEPAIALDYLHFDYSFDKKYKTANVRFKVALKNKTNINESIDLQVSIKNAEGHIIAEYNKKLDSWDKAEDIASLSIKKPILWSPSQPYLYDVELSLKSKYGTHTIHDKLGLMDFDFVKKGPFMLNGERLLLRGTHRHEDHAAMAAATSDKVIRQEMMMMKEMGVNFIRLGHYQQTRYVLDLCDSLGIMAWEEIPWCRGGLGGDVYKDQARRMLKNMINQHYNHASVVIWGLGNENDWPGDFDHFDEENIKTFMSELNDIAHDMDLKRKTAIRRCDFCKDIVDVYSPSIWAGWYRGKYTNYAKVSYEEAMKVDHFLHVEWGASNHAGRHSETPDEGLADIISEGADERDGDFLMTGGVKRASKDGDWSESYACNLIDWHLKEQENMDWLTGTAYWPFKDFSTPIRPENPVPYMNQKGVVQRDLTKKESFYVFQSYWSEKPMAHIYGHTWPVRHGDLGQKRIVKVYSNCNKAELFLNGKSVGIKNRNSANFPAAGLRWSLAFAAGENTLKVVATKGKEVVVDEITFIYQTEKWSTPTKLILKKISKKGNTVTLEAKLYDSKGIFCPDAKNTVEFGVTGEAQLIDNLGTWDGSRKIQLYNGRAMIKITKKGQFVASVKSEGLKTGFYSRIKTE